MLPKNPWMAEESEEFRRFRRFPRCVQLAPGGIAAAQGENADAPYALCDDGTMWVMPKPLYRSLHSACPA
jgi:hypothetical protein